MSIEGLLPRLDKVRKVGTGRWMARCPAHDDRGPSLSIRQIEDGRILLHDFGGCAVLDVLGAVGLDMADLHPMPLAHRGQPVRRPWIPADAFEALRHEVGVVAVIGADMHKRLAVTEADYERLFVAVQRLNNIASYGYGI